MEENPYAYEGDPYEADRSILVIFAFKAGSLCFLNRKFVSSSLDNLKEG